VFGIILFNDFAKLNEFFFNTFFKKNMRYFLILFFIQVHSQVIIQDSIYIVTRGTNEKRELIADNFNLYNKNITHVGIGIWKNNNLLIYNLMPTEDKNNLIIDNLLTFFNRDNIYYKAIYSCAINSSNMNLLINKLTNLKSINLKYDYEFSIHNDNFYCSEFVAYLLNNLEDFDFKTTISDSCFEYYPADFFLSDPRFKLVYLNQINNLIKQ